MRLVKRIAAAAAVLVAAMVLSGASYEMVMRRHAVRDFKIPGRLVDVGGGRRIQIDCRGSGSPTVVLESGLDAYGSLAWAAVHDSLAATTRVCAYSRAGIMWSDPADGPFDSKAVARDLHAALTAAGESAPWVMAGHSLGGPYVTTFTKLYDAEVRGLVFIDATHPDQFARFREVAGKSMEPKAGVARIGAALAWAGIVRLMPAAPTPESWPRDVGRIAPAFLPVSLGALVKEVDAVPATLGTAGETRSFGDRPFVTLTATHGPPPAALAAMGITPDQGERLQAASRSLHESQATWSRRGRHELVPDASHYIQFDRPDVVIIVVREVVDAVRVESR